MSGESIVNCLRLFAMCCRADCSLDSAGIDLLLNAAKKIEHLCAEVEKLNKELAHQKKEERCVAVEDIDVPAFAGRLRRSAILFFLSFE